MRIIGALVVIGAVVCVSPACVAAQAPVCHVVCSPTIDLMPGAIRTHLFGGPRVQSLATGAVSRLPSSWNMEIIIATAMQTQLPRTSVFASVQWLPNASESRNPFTSYTASELGGHLRANAPTATFGLSFSALTAKQTKVVDVNANVGDLFSQAARPGDRSSYTHKLDLDLVTHWHVFDWSPAHTYVHRVTAYGILDYVATGLPRAGDEVPQGRRFLSAARPTSLILGLSLPLTPESR